MHRSSDTMGTEELWKQPTVHTFVHHTQHTCVIHSLMKCSSSSIWKGDTLRCSSPMPCRWKFASKRYELSLTLTGQQPPTQGPAPATARVGFYWLVNVTDGSTRSVCLSAATQRLPCFIKRMTTVGQLVPVGYWLQILQHTGLCQPVGYKLCGH